MDVRLDNLIEKIKKEGIDEAQQTSEEIIRKAKEEAAQTAENAKKEAEKIIENGKNQAAKFQASAERALQQAARDTELLMKERITTMLDAVFKRKVSQSLSPEFLKEIIMKVISEWVKKSEAEIVLSGADKEKLQSLLFAGLKEDLKDSITIKMSDTGAKGFRVGLKGEDVYYDFSDDSIAAMLKMFLSPSLKEIMDQRKDG